MKIIFEFSVWTKYINSQVKENVELEFDDDATEDEIEDEVADIWDDWRNRQCDGYWKRI